MVSNHTNKKDEMAQDFLAATDDGLTSGDTIRALCRTAIAEGCVLLKNDGTLPLGTKKFALFGRCQIDTFYVGYGSGGDVKPPYRVSLLEGLENGGAALDPRVVSVYRDFSATHVPVIGGWGEEARFYEEMPLDEEFVAEAAKENETAVVVIGRAAGEGRENAEERGSWYLTEQEEANLALIRRHFRKMCVLLNCGSIMDIAGVESYSPDALMLIWQGGQETGNGVADLLLGKAYPSGRLTDTLAKIEDYPSYGAFGTEEYTEYKEDIYVGYRYFNTFAEDKIIYPFGFGFGYTSFDISDCRVRRDGDTALRFTFTVKNTGEQKGKEVAEVYLSAPQGKLGKPAKVLLAYIKTKELAPGEGTDVSVTADLKSAASYDDSGVTGHKNCFVLEAGEYRLFLGENVRDNREVSAVTLPALIVTAECEEACAPKHPFSRMVNADGLKYEEVPLATEDLRERILSRLPKPLAKEKNAPRDLSEVAKGKGTLDAFIAELSENELEELTRGSLYQMNSPFGPKGNAGTFGANCDELFAKGIPAICTNDGPSGVRLQAHSTLLPNGTLLASTFNCDLVEEIACEYGKEIVERKSHVALAPGMNIHRHPLCGRNFEYFSEDPYLTGKTAAAYVRGVQKTGTSATPKHFACNNQETYRGVHDARISQRALREIYLKGFEICVKEANPDCIMTSYNKINGTWNYYNYDLATTILRGEWGFDGCVMTDWWMKEGESDLFTGLKTQGYRVRAQVDVFMPGAPSRGEFRGKSDGTFLASLHAEDGLTLAEAQRSVKNVLRLCLKHMK